jgi:hypothetical protein
VLSAVVSTEKQVVELDLRYGIVKGYSPHVSFIHPPRPSYSKRCDTQAVIKVDFSGPFKSAKFNLDYADRPRLWTFDVSDSPDADGYGGGYENTSRAEVQIFNKQMRIFSNSLPGYSEVTINGGYLMKVVDNIVRKGIKQMIEVSHERLEWTHGDYKTFIESKFLFELNGQSRDPKRPDYLYAGFNRVVAGDFRSGTGLCRVVITLSRFQNEDGKLSVAFSIEARLFCCFILLETD